LQFTNHERTRRTTMCGESVCKRMRIEVAGAEGGEHDEGLRTSAFMLVERASLYMLACSDGSAGHAERMVLDALRTGFADVQVAADADDDEAVFSTLLSLYAGMLVSNDLVRARRQAGEDVGVSSAAVALRGGSLCITRAGGVRVSRIGRGGVEHLADGAQSEPETLALGLLPRGAAKPFSDTWEPGDILVLARNELADAVGARLLARTVLEAKSLGDAARELAAHGDAVVLIRWLR
jgi:hypothetical protein